MKRNGAFLPALMVGGLVFVALSQASSMATAQEGQPHMPSGPQAPTGTAFTYQGKLTDGSGPANGDYDFQFILYDAASGGSQVGTTLTTEDSPVSDGLFTVALDFGDVFDGTALWLEVGVREGSSTGAYTTLSPRQALTAAPYALYAPGNHDHLGQTWTGANNPLKIEGSFDTSPEDAPLVLHNSGDSGDGLHVSSNSYGVVVESAGADGIRVSSAGTDGVSVVTAGWDGVFVDSAGYNGVSVASANGDGVNVGTVGGHGVDVYSAGGNGLRVGGAGLNGAELWNATYDGVQVNEAGRYGVQSDTNGTYGFYTPDTIYAGGGCVGCTSMLIAQNGGETDLEPGDLVALDGLTDPLNPESIRPVLIVQKAEAASAQSIIGVVEGHYVYKEMHAQAAREQIVETSSLANVAGAGFSRQVAESIQMEPAAPGDYLVVVYRGQVRVKIDATDSPIQAGDLLSVADTPGYAAKARPLTIEGAGEAGIYPSGTILGKALEPLNGDMGFIWVLVDLQ